MTKRPTTSRQTRDEQSSVVQQTSQDAISPQRQQEQSVLLEPFYNRLIGMTFDQSTTAIERCRDLCAEFGFTVKQEASTHRNIYVYCSREGLPDSLRNPKSNPQRKRPSKRCDCRWRVVLFENENQWEFRKSLNPEAGKHNHELMRPEEIERSWPKEVTALICELARLRITTQDIRSRVRGQFPNIHWNERRFYNRLSEERQKIKLRDTAERTHQLTQLWSKVCMATAGNDELSEFVKQEMVMLFQSVCETAHIDPQSFPSSSISKDDDYVSEASTPSSVGQDNNSAADPYDTNAGLSISNERTESKPFKAYVKQDGTSTGSTTAAKGFITVEIPKQIYYIKIHNQRQLHESQLLKNQRRPRTYSEDANSPNSFEPARKMSRKGKEKQCALEEQPDPLQSIIAQPYPNRANATNVSIPSPRQHDIHQQQRQQQQQQHQQQQHQQHQQQHQHQQQQQQQQLQQPATTFVYYENSSMPLDSSLSSYVHPSFPNNYNINSAPNTPGFNTQELTFSFDSSMNRNNVDSSESSNHNEPNIHPALQSMPHQQKPPQHKKSLNAIIPQSQQSGNNSRLYGLSTVSNTTNINNNNSNNKQQMRAVYESPKDNNIRSLIPDTQPSYQRQQQGLYMRQPSSPNQHHITNSILPMYQQQQLPPDALRLSNMHHQNPPQQ